MPTTQQFFAYSQTATASYATGLVSGDNNIDRYTATPAEMSAAQAA